MEDSAAILCAPGHVIRMTRRRLHGRRFFVALIVNAIISVLCGVLTILILQAWPPRYRWSKDIALTIGLPSRSPIYQARFFRPRRLIWKQRSGPVDAFFKARIAVVGLTRPGVEHIVEIPVIREWRPVLGRSVSVYVLPQLCRYSDLRYFPPDIKEKRLGGQLRLEDLLGAGDSAVLRMYVFAYRPHTGTRWMRRGVYTLTSIKPGRFKGSELEDPPDNRPPEVEDLHVEHPLLSQATPASNGGPEPGAVLTFGSLTIKVHRRPRQQ